MTLATARGDDSNSKDGDSGRLQGQGGDDNRESDCGAVFAMAHILLRVEALLPPVPVGSHARDEKRDVGRPHFIIAGEELPHVCGLDLHHRHVDRQEERRQPQAQPQTAAADGAPGRHYETAEIERVPSERVRAAHRQFGVLPQMSRSPRAKERAAQGDWDADRKCPPRRSRKKDEEDSRDKSDRHPQTLNQKEQTVIRCLFSHIHLQTDQTGGTQSESAPLAIASDATYVRSLMETRSLPLAALTHNPQSAISLQPPATRSRPESSCTRCGCNCGDNNRCGNRGRSVRRRRRPARTARCGATWSGRRWPRSASAPPPRCASAPCLRR